MRNKALHFALNIWPKEPRTQLLFQYYWEFSPSLTQDREALAGVKYVRLSKNIRN